jgi:hypothetical protein
MLLSLAREVSTQGHLNPHNRAMSFPASSDGWNDVRPVDVTGGPGARGSSFRAGRIRFNLTISPDQQ